MGLIYLPHRRLHHSGDQAWASWDEVSEATLDKDQDGDGSEDTFVCFFENAVAGGDEIGQGGGLSEANRTLTEQGNVAGASGGYRSLDGTDDEFRFVQDDFFNAMLVGQAEWTIIIKCYMDSSDLQTYLKFSDTNAIIQIDNNSGNLRFSLDDNDAAEANDLTNAISGHDDQVCYLAVWTSAADGVTRAGWTTTRPTKWSDFNVNDRVAFAAIFDNLAAHSSAGGYSLFGATGAGYSKGRLYYVVVSKACLIDNAA